MTKRRGFKMVKRKRMWNTGLRGECFLHERGSGDTFIPVVYDNFLLLEDFVLLLLLQLSCSELHLAALNLD